MGAAALTSQSFIRSIQSGVCLVDFWAVWCGPCKIQLPIVNELADELKGKVSIFTVNVDAERELASKYGIRSLPTLLLFKDGKVMDQFVGLRQKSELKSKVMKLASK
ncbi:thioredoxin [Paenibacillus cellulosilyticus]|uniref:Thioredoxin n=1 Tax=Paenibacillus cellulosilyticus TaxID=375489 RepID=A0A2V2YQ97_9BACL|nr:thioredoxin [Paenibacillus cellulosilyticus]PWV95226.1 thioredoxin [Paenibacillus cellulosilyticus]QKS46026.1 thioredoxin [Paenibacillus cellulosilyticus]